MNTFIPFNEKIINHLFNLNETLYGFTESRSHENCERSLKILEENEFSSYIYTLASLISQKDLKIDLRILASRMLKNCIAVRDSHEKSLQAEYRKRYIEQPMELRSYIKNLLMSTLVSSEPLVGRYVAQVISKIAAIEIPIKQWPDIILSLTSINNSQDSRLQQRIVEVLGYICEDLSCNKKYTVLSESDVNLMLTFIVQGMITTESETLLMSTHALKDLLKFCRPNFELESERDYILQVVCKNCLYPDCEVRKASLECLSEIAIIYYNILPKYIEAFLNLTHNALQNDPEEIVSLLSINLWCEIAGREIDILDQNVKTGIAKQSSHDIIKNVASSLVPMLIEQLSKQYETEIDRELWSVSIAGADCLSLIAQCIQNDILELVLPYIQNNISKQDQPEAWRKREAATTAFAAIMNGPDLDRIAFLVNTGLDLILDLLKDNNIYVRESAAFTISRALKYAHTPNITFVSSAKNLQRLIEALIQKTEDELSVATRACEAIMHLFAGFDGSNTDLLPYFQSLNSRLLTVALETGHDNTLLKLASYEAINEMIRFVPKNNVQLIGELFSDLLHRLQRAEVEENQTNTIGYICGVVQVTLQKLNKEKAIIMIQEKVIPAADYVMHLMLSVLNYPDSDIHEEAILVVSAMTYILKEDFSRYLQLFYPVLEACIENYQDSQRCDLAVCLLGDICRAVQSDFVPYLDRNITLLIMLLTSSKVHKSIKPMVLSTIGDIAISMSEPFKPYIISTIQLLKSALEHIKIHPYLHYEDFIYYDQLQCGIFYTFSSILHGSDNKHSFSHEINLKLSSETPQILNFILKISQHVDKSFYRGDAKSLKSAIGLLWDITSNISGVKEMFMKIPDLIMIIIKISRDSKFTNDCSMTAGNLATAISKIP